MDSMTSLMRRLRDLEDRINQTGSIDRNRAVVARYKTAVAQNFPAPGATIVQYDTVEFDPDSHVTTGVAWKFTAKIPGYYHVEAGALLALSNAWALGEEADLQIFRNGVLYSVVDRDDEMNSTVTPQYKHLHGSDLVYLAATEYVDIRLNQNSGGALALFNFAPFNYVSIFKVN